MVKNVGGNGLQRKCDGLPEDRFPGIYGIEIIQKSVYESFIFIHMPYIIPCSSIAVATFMKPAILAPFT